MNEAQVIDYLDRSGDKAIPQGNIEDNEHGFCIWKIHKGRLVLISVYGDGEYWDDWSIQKAKEMKLKSIIVGTKRSPRPFVRKYGYKITGYMLEKEVRHG